MAEPRETDIVYFSLMELYAHPIQIYGFVIVGSTQTFTRRVNILSATPAAASTNTMSRFR